MSIRRFCLLACAAFFAWLMLLPGLVSPARLVAAQTEEAAKAVKPDDKPMPIVKSNCVRCHSKAGRELTEAVHTFAQSAHDFAELSCADCHSGNTEDDTKAHGDEFGFIGTKMSAHLAKCRSCHEDQAAELAKGPHFWDHDKQLNQKFPLCVDCHGNHDVGNPPADFSLTLVCQDCHKDYETKFPSYARLTKANDELWESIRAYRSKHGPKEMPEPLAEEVASVRAATAAAAHFSKGFSDDASKALHQRIDALRQRLAAEAPAKSK